MSMHGYTTVSPERYLCALAYFRILQGYRYILIFMRCFFYHVRKPLAPQLTIPSNKEYPAVMVSHKIKTLAFSAIVTWEHQLICLQYLQKTHKKGYWLKNSFVKLTGILLKAYVTHLEAITCLPFYRHVLLEGKDKGNHAHLYLIHLVKIAWIILM